MQSCKRYIEKLSHYTCTSCEKWFSISDAPDREIWYCPWCGLAMTVETDYLIKEKEAKENAKNR